MARWTRDKDGRSTEEIKDATRILADAARGASDPRNTPLEKSLVPHFHEAINMNLDELSRRGKKGS